VSKNLQNKFNFFVEADIKKGKDEKGEELIYIDGIASTCSVEDSDEETLYPSGFNLLPFLEAGLVNYNHQGSKDSNANIGVPVEAKVINNGKDLYVKCMLWPCPQTTGIVTAYESFQKYNIDRKVGFSIEGRSTYKDPFNKKRILKADITGLAVTFCPKNKNTLMNIIKGEYENAFIEPEGEEDEKEKAIDTAAIAPATPESVEHDPKDISNKKISNFGGLLKKSDIYIEIAKSFPHNSIADQKSIYDFVVQVNTKLFKMEVITPEALQKAKDILNEATTLVKSEPNQSLENTNTNEGKEGKTAGDIIIKGEDSVDFENEDVKKALDTARVLVKGGMEKEAGCDVMMKGGIEATVAQASWEKALSEMQSQQNGGGVTSQEAPIMKSEEVTALVSTEIRKSLDPVNGSLNKVNEAISKGFEGLGTIIKSLEQSNQALSQQNTEFVERLAKLEGQSQGRKSATNAQSIERFVKSEDGNSPDADTFNVTSQSDLNRLSDRLFVEHESAVEKGRKDDAQLFEGTINSIEISKSVPQFAFKRLAQLGIKLVAPSK
jgi:hypothetical protein